MSDKTNLGKGVRFERIRRITGYLVGTMDRWNDAKTAEERDRVKRIVIEEMEKAYAMQVPLRADCGWGKNWLEAH